MRPMDAETGTSTCEKSDEAGSSSVQMQDLTRLKRSNSDPAEETAIKRHQNNDSITDSSKPKVNEPSLLHTDKKKCIDDLPFELIEAILKRMPTVEIRTCRQINRQWNEIASRVMRRRDDVELRFRFYTEKFVQETKYRCCEVLLVDICKPNYTYGSKCLTDLMACMSENFPCTNFHFNDLGDFANEDMQQFLSIWGENILQLKVNIDDPIKSVHMLRELLFEEVTNLKKLELQFCKDEASLIFDKRQPSTIQILEDGMKLQLPNLEVLCVNERFSKFYSVVGNILEAACNLKTFEMIVESKSVPQYGPSMVHSDRIVIAKESITADGLAMLHSFNKLHCLKNLRLYVSEELIAYWATSSNAMANLQLQSLAFSIKPSIWESDTLKHRATLMINQLFRSNKDVMETLSIEPLALLSGLVIPEMKNLEKLVLGGFPWTKVTNNAMFPVLFEMANAFPNVKELDMYIMGEHDYFPSSEPLKTMTSVKVLRIYGNKCTKCKEKLMKATPNVTTLLMVEDDFIRTENLDVSINFGVIANNLPKLESFGWLICRFSPRELLYKLDAVITGLPEQICKKLSKQFHKKNSLSAEELQELQLQLQVHRVNSSIVDLKELKKLDVTLFVCFELYCEAVDSNVDQAGFNSENVFYRTGFTKVSKFLAFDLMPGLKVRAHKRTE